MNDSSVIWYFILSASAPDHLSHYAEEIATEGHHQAVECLLVAIAPCQQ
jgi:hypothetical protein